MPPIRISSTPLLTFLCAVACVGADDRASPPIVYLPMDGVVNDVGRSGFPVLTMGDDISFAEGVDGEAVFIGGTEDWVEVDIGRQLDLARGASLELWVKRDDWVNPYGAGSGAQTIVTLDPLTIDLMVLEGRNPDRNRARGSVRTENERITVTSNFQLPAGRWTHLALVYDAGEASARLYVDGEERATEPVPEPLTTRYVNPLKVGTWFKANQAFRGWVDDVKLYDYARTGLEISEAAAR